MKQKQIFISILLILTLILAACGSQANPEANEPQNNANESPTNTAEVEPETDVTPSVEVADQEISNGSVTVPSVTMAENGWVVIHTTSAEGTPGPVIGYAPVPEGESTDVTVNIEADQATPQLFAMLHIDAGTEGTYEFPGDDGPVKDGDAVVMKPFNLEGLTASISVSDQELMDGSVVVDSAYMLQPGWVVIHITTEDGTPGPVIGHAALPAGPSTDISVSIDTEQATPQLFAMLHIDEGEAGTYEFPGDDAPVTEDEKVVVKPFNVAGISEGHSDDSSGETSMDEVEVDIANFAFGPNEIEVKVGTTVTWTNMDSAAHTATADDGTFDSGSLGTDDSFSFTFTEAGTFSYYCKFHPSMTATITVVP